MKPLFVRELSGPERQALQAGLRSSDGVTVRRCHMLLASARGDTTTVIAQAVGCSPQAVRNVLRAFETRGLAVVAPQSRRPHTAAKLFDAERSERLKALLPQSPRQFGRARSTWTLALGPWPWPPRSAPSPGSRPSGSVMRPSGTRSSGWGSAGGGPRPGSPARTRNTRSKKLARPPDRLGGPPPRLGGGLCRRGLVEPLGPADDARLGRDAAAQSQSTGEGRSAAQSSGLLRAVADRPGSGAAALCRRPPGQPRHHGLSGLGGRPARCGGQARMGAGVGQRRLARQPSGACVAWGAYPHGEARRRGPDPGVSAAGEKPLAQPDRAALVARQAGDRRAGADVNGPRAHGPGASALPM